MKRFGHLGVWALQIGLAAVFATAGYRKLSGHPIPVETFGQIGLGDGFLYATAAAELAGAAGLLVPGLAMWTALGLGFVMVGAAATHLFVIGGSPAPALGLLAAALVIVWARRASAWGLGRARSRRGLEGASDGG